MLWHDAGQAVSSRGRQRQGAPPQPHLLCAVQGGHPVKARLLQQPCVLLRRGGTAGGGAVREGTQLT